MAYLALFVALGGTGAYAANEWTGDNIVDDSLTGADVKGRPGVGTTAAVNGTILTQDVGGQPASPISGTPFVDGTLTTYDVRNNALRTDDVLDNSLTNADIKNAASGSDDVNADQLDGLDSTKLVRAHSGFPGGEVSYNRNRFPYPNTIANTILQVDSVGFFFGSVVGWCDENGIRIGFHNGGIDGLEVLTHDAGSPPAWNVIGSGEIEWAPFHFSTASTTFQLASGVGNDFVGTGERVATVWASGRISPPEGSQCIFQAQALHQAG